MTIDLCFSFFEVKIQIQSSSVFANFQWNLLLHSSSCFLQIFLSAWPSLVEEFGKPSVNYIILDYNYGHHISTASGLTEVVLLSARTPHTCIVVNHEYAFANDLRVGV